MTQIISPLTIAVTGASGYVGGMIAAGLRQSGAAVHHLGRRSQPDAAAESPLPPHHFFELGKPVDPALFSGIDALVHCAYDFRVAGWKDIHAVNVLGSCQLFAAAKSAGVKRIIFLSTMSAFPGCKSLYGKAKLEIESHADEFQLSVVRPGLVYGDKPGGMVGALTKLLSLPGFVPLVGTGRQVLYLAHERDLANLIAHLCRPDVQLPAVPVIAANSQGKTFREILQTLAASRGQKKLFIPVPWQLEWAMLKSAELIGLRPRLRSDSLISLINQDPHPDFAATRATPITFRDFNP